MPEPQPYIVGRQSEVARFAALLEGRVPHWLLNISATPSSSATPTVKFHDKIRELLLARLKLNKAV